MLYIICPQSYRYKDQLKKLAFKVGLKNYQILDPVFYSMDKSFQYVLLVGAIKEEIKASHQWQIEPPELDLSKEKKMEILKQFQMIQRFILSRQDKTLIQKDDLPRAKDLEDFLKDYMGQVMELKLSDGRLMGIYPDGDRLEMKYPIEYHVSTVVNLARIKELFEAQRIIIKDL